METPKYNPVAGRHHPGLPVVIALLASIIVICGYLVAASAWSLWPYQNSATPITAVQYRNTQFRFSVDLPDSWRGFTVVTQPEDIYDVSGNTTTNNGVVGHFNTFRIQHPLSTTAHPRQDIPVMVFTTAQWSHVVAEEWSVSAAPIPPSVLASTSAYVFALPPRYNFAYQDGWEEIQQILNSRPVHTY